MTNNLKALKRETKTTKQVNELRSKGFIPAILYGGKSPNLKISVEEKLDIWDYFDSFISTAFFLLFITPDNIKKSNKDKDVTSIKIDKLAGSQ